MKILYLDWNNYGGLYIQNAFKNNGDTVISYPLDVDKNMKNDEQICQDLVKTILNTHPDICFSLNFFPIVAIACKACNVKYVSWTYDSPYCFLYSDSIFFETNYAFIFDRTEYENLLKLGVQTIYYLPLGAPISEYSHVKSTLFTHYNTDVSMIGSLYSEEKHRLMAKLNGISDFSKGYIEGLINMQKFMYGADIIETSLNNKVLSELTALAPFLHPSDELQTLGWMYSKYFFLREVTRRERAEYLYALDSSKLGASLFTFEATPNYHNIINKGPLDYYSQMPLAIHNSKINLNITLRSIVTGIPLRSMDIMGCGSFLLTNYQNEMFDFFTPYEDFDFFENPEELVDKSCFYIAHEDVREKIAQNALCKMSEHHSIETRISQIKNTIGMV